MNAAERLGVYVEQACKSGLRADEIWVSERFYRELKRLGVVKNYGSFSRGKEIQFCLHESDDVEVIHRRWWGGVKGKKTFPDKSLRDSENLTGLLGGAGEADRAREESDYWLDETANPMGETNLPAVLLVYGLSVALDAYDASIGRAVNSARRVIRGYRKRRIQKGI